MSTDFNNSFTVRPIFSDLLLRKMALKRPPHLKSVAALLCETCMRNCTTLQKSYLTQYGAITFNFSKYLPGMLSACSYAYADKFTACVQNVRLPNACMHRNVSCVHVRRLARPSWCPSELQNSAAQSCFFCKARGENKRCLLL